MGSQCHFTSDGFVCTKGVGHLDRHAGYYERGAPPPTPPLAAIEAERSEFYGDPLESHTAIGLAWEGVFRNRYQDLRQLDECVGPTTLPIFPADLVALMLAAFKVVRAARPKYKQDSYDDAHVYLDFSERFRKL